MDTKFKETKIGRIPEEWSIANLSEVVELRHGYQFREYDFTQSGIAVIKIGNLIDGNLYLDDITFIDANRLPEFNNYVVRNGDLLMSLTGNIGRVVEVKGLGNPILQNYRVGHFSPRVGRLTKQYLKYALSSELLTRQMNKFANQTAQANFGKKDLDKLFLSYPASLPEQRQIAEILSTVDDTIEKTDAVIRQTLQLKKGLMQKLFTDGIDHTRFKETKIGRIPEEWEVVRLNQCLQKTKREDPTKRPDEKFTYIDVSAVSNEFFKIVESKTILGKDAPSRARKGINTGDTIYATVRPYLKRVAFVPSELDGEICSTGYCVLRPKSEEIFHRFVFQLMLTHRVNEYLKSLQAGTSYPAINDSDVYQMLIPKPPLPEQRRIAEILSEVDAKIETERAFKSELEKLKKGLMQVLLTGKVRVKV